ncbi:MAG: hypothetical protein GYB31_14875 [Bacteroidetes bacterium]|nr:hypothetical protein [Bacteroidota bacterium]
MKQLLIILFLFAGTSGAFAQVDSAGDFRFGIKFIPSFLLDFTGPSTEGGIEVSLKEHWTIQQDFGFISSWDGRYFLTRGTNPLEGYRFRTTLRYYTREKNWGEFQGLALGYKYLERDRSERFCREDCAYFQTLDYTLVTNDISIHYLYGSKGVFAKVGLIEVFVGGGFRMYKRSDSDSIPDDADAFNNNLFQLRRNVWRTVPSLILSLAIGFGL